MERCPWCGNDPLYVAYHDTEWGVPCHDERTLFEFLILEGAQAGLSWITILRKRENYRRAFDDFDPAKHRPLWRAGRGATARRRRHRPQPAQDRRHHRQRPRHAGTLRTGRQPGPAAVAFRRWAPAINRWRAGQKSGHHTDAEALSKELKRRGFRFVGPTVIYAHMQATGMVNDHLVTCPPTRRPRSLKAAAP